MTTTTKAQAKRTNDRIAALEVEIAETKVQYADRPGMRDLMVANLEKDIAVVRSRG